MPHTSLKHMLTIDSLCVEQIHAILDKATAFMDGKSLRADIPQDLKGITVCPLFFENSTRTACSFQLAAKRLGATMLDLNIETSATHKGETIIDTVQNLEAMGTQAFIIRHKENGTSENVAQHVKPDTQVLNAGDGNHAHPTQALLDVLTIQQYCGDFTTLKVGIFGDLKHSRVARSQIAALQKLGVAELRAVGPKALIPDELANKGVQLHYDMNEGLKDLDVVIMLRIQKERMGATDIPDTDAYFKQYGLTTERLAHAKDNAIVMHPGPMNRGVEISSEVADGPQSVILQQVTNGVATRMAILSLMFAA